MVTNSALVGRAEQLRCLSDLAQLAAGGDRQIVFLNGPIGIGKSALVQGCTERLRGFRQASVGGTPGERLIDFAAANRLVQTLRGEEPLAAGEQIPLDSTVLSAGGALIAAVDDFKGDRPMVLLVEDAHQMDAASLQAIGFMLLRIPTDRVLTIFNSVHAHQTRRETGFVREGPGITQIDLQGLTTGETRDLLAVLGVETVSPSRLAAIHRWSAGNPLYLRAMVRPTGPDRLLPENPAHGPVAPSLTQVVQDWAKTFPGGGARILEALAVLGAPADLRVLRHMTRSSTLLEDVEPLIAEGAAKWFPAGSGNDRIELIHRGQQDALYAGIPVARRKQLHRDAAAALDPPDRWRHQVAAAGTFDPELARQLSAAVRSELTEGDAAQAAQFLLGIAEVDPDGAARSAALLHAVRLLVSLGQYQAALAEAPRVRGLPAGPERSEVLGLLHIARGHDAAALEHLLVARQGYGGDEEDASRASMELASVQVNLGLGQEALEAAQFAVTHSSDAAVIGQAHRSIIFATAMLNGPIEALRNLYFLRDNPTNVSAYDLGSLAFRGILRCLTGDLHASLSDLTVASRRRSHELTQLWGFGPMGHAAAAHALLGEMAEARRTLSLAFHEAQTVGRGPDFAALHGFSAFVSAFQGRWDTAEEDLAEARILAAASDFSGPEYQMVQSAAAVAFARQDWRAVIDPLARVINEPTHRDRARLYWLWSLPMLGVAHARRGDAEASEEMATALGRLDAENPLVAISTAWVRGNASAARHDLHGALRHLRDGLAVSSSGGEPALHRALLRMDYGRFLLESGDGSEAARQLTQAAEGFRGMGAAPFAKQCAELLKGTDHALETSRAEHFWENLTDREQDVAKLLGQGWTNKEIAQELYVTTKTVEYHLRNIYAKGEAENRRQVRDLVQALEAGKY